ncbi:MAG: 50S ribosomal protein L35ae [Candidatus Pacearchaeota archaeon]
MQGIVVNFRRGKRTYKPRHFLIQIEGINDRKKAKELVGKIVTWKSSSGKEINGKIASPHGNKGILRVIFEKGLPGQALTQKVEIK